MEANRTGDRTLAKLEELGHELPPSQAPVGKYHYAVRDGDTVHLAGHGPFLDGKAKYTGKLGRDMSQQDVYEANRFVGLTMLRTLKDALGSLDRVVRPLTQTNYINVDGTVGGKYFDASNGSTDLWIALWGEELGQCARMSVGVSELPEGVPTAIVSSWKVLPD